MIWPPWDSPDPRKQADWFHFRNLVAAGTHGSQLLAEFTKVAEKVFSLFLRKNPQPISLKAFLGRSKPKLVVKPWCPVPIKPAGNSLLGLWPP